MMEFAKNKVWMDGMKYNSNIVVTGIDYNINDSVVYEHNNKVHKAMIKYNKAGRAYFDTKIDGRHYLDNFTNVYGIAH